jgi:hypothetical protein
VGQDRVGVAVRGGTNGETAHYMERVPVKADAGFTRRPLHKAAALDGRTGETAGTDKPR